MRKFLMILTLILLSSCASARRDVSNFLEGYELGFMDGCATSMPRAQCANEETAKLWKDK